jgi:hypothetical protein
MFIVVISVWPLVGCADAKKAAESNANGARHADPAKPSENDLRIGLDGFLRHSRQHCIYLGALQLRSFPVELKEVEGPDMRRLQVLEKHGLFVSRETTRTRRARLRTYVLTDWGKKYYDSADVPGCFCYGQGGVDTIVKWSYDPPGSAVVTYRYTIASLAEWAKSVDVQKEFPEIRQDLEGARKTEKDVHLARLGDGWGVLVY